MSSGSPYDQPLNYPFAVNLFGLNNTSSGAYLLPKPKFLYYVSFKITTAYQLPPDQQPRLGYIAKAVERPKFEYGTQELDQYNRKRLIHTKVSYPTISLTFYDTVDSVVTKLIDDHNRYNFGDFSNFVGGDGSDSYNNYWTPNTITGNDSTYWGYRLKNPSNYFSSAGNIGPRYRGLPTAPNFFEEIRIYEFYGNNFTQYSIMNPKIKSVNQETHASESVSEFMEVSLTIEPEGVVYNYIDAPIEVSAAASMIMPGAGFSTNNFPISENDVTSFLANSISRAGGGLLSGLENGIMGSFGSLNNSLNGALGILGGGLLQVASTSLLSSSGGSSSILSSFSSVAGSTTNPIVNSVMPGMRAITGAAESAISLGYSAISSGVQQTLNNISDLI